MSDQTNLHPSKYALRLQRFPENTKCKQHNIIIYQANQPTSVDNIQLSDYNFALVACEKSASSLTVPNTPDFLRVLKFPPVVTLDQ
jgi:hypothetical protein